MKVSPITYEKIESIWRLYLWPGRQSSIEPISWINHMGQIDMTLKIGSPTFWGAFESDVILGVISGFKTSPEMYRSRGIWVAPDHRNRGLGRLLLEEVDKQAVREGCRAVWTMPRSSSWEFYSKMGFRITGTTDQYEFGPHLLALKSLSNP